MVAAAVARVVVAVAMVAAAMVLAAAVVAALARPMPLAVRVRG